MMTAAVESEAPETSFFSLSLACRPRGFRLKRKRSTELELELELILYRPLWERGEKGGAPI